MNLIFIEIKRRKFTVFFNLTGEKKNYTFYSIQFMECADCAPCNEKNGNR